MRNCTPQRRGAHALGVTQAAAKAIDPKESAKGTPPPVSPASWVFSAMIASTVNGCEAPDMGMEKREGERLEDVKLAVATLQLCFLTCWIVGSRPCWARSATVLRTSCCSCGHLTCRLGRAHKRARPHLLTAQLVARGLFIMLSSAVLANVAFCTLYILGLRVIIPQAVLCLLAGLSFKASSSDSGVLR